MYVCYCYSYESGLVLATICNLLITIPLGISLVLVLETMARGSAVLACADARKVNDDDSDSMCLIDSSKSSNNNDNDSNDDTNSNTRGAADSNNLLLVGEKKIELADLAGMFLGQNGKYCFIVFVR
jgi:hypothetical protein